HTLATEGRGDALTNLPDPAILQDALLLTLSSTLYGSPGLQRLIKDASVFKIPTSSRRHFILTSSSLTSPSVKVTMMDSLVTALDAELVVAGETMTRALGNRCRAAHAVLSDVTKGPADSDRLNSKASPFIYGGVPNHGY
ncbi:hypothetical protein OTU49_005310, partial [Cherax quadricarinatus]